MVAPLVAKVVAVAIIGVLVGFAGYWLVLFEEGDFRAEIRIDSVEDLGDAIELGVTLRIVNGGGVSVFVDSLSAKVYADAERTVPVTLLEASNIFIPAGGTHESQHQIVLTNLEEIGELVWVVVDFKWHAEGETIRHQEHVERAVDLPAVLA